MDILVLIPEPAFPPVSGGRIRIFNTIKQLSLNHNVYLISLVEDNKELAYREELLKYCCDVALFPKDSSIVRILKRKISCYFGSNLNYVAQFYKREVEAKIEEFMTRYPIDVIHVEHCYMDLYHLDKWRTKGVKKVLVQQNLEYVLFDQHVKATKASDSLRRKLENFMDNRKFKDFETKVMRNQDMVVAMSEEDRRKIVDLAPEIDERTVVVPNGVDTNFFQPPEAGRKQATLVFTGFMQYVPNEDGIVWFCDEILPEICAKVPEVQVLVVGRNPSEKVLRLQETSARITVTGFVEDVRNYLNTSTVFICPLRMGSGTRLKIMEAMASGIPIVSTSIGSEGIEVTDGQDIILADNARGFATKTLDLLGDPDKRAVISANARKLVEDKYSWKGIANNYQKELLKMVHGSDEGGHLEDCL